MNKDTKKEIDMIFGLGQEGVKTEADLHSEKKSARFFVKKPIIMVAIISLLIGIGAGAVAGIFTSSYIFSNFTPYFLSNVVNLRSSEIPRTIDQDTSQEGMVIRAVENINPSVVSIVVSKYVSRYYSPWGDQFPNDFFDNPFFNFPFDFGSGQNILPDKQKKEKQEIGGGTGFVISSKDGLILTNKHVVSDEEAEYTVVTNDGEKYEAKVLARDPFNDAAVLKVEVESLPEVKLGNSDDLKIGQTVIAIGNALGEYRNTVTSGVISGISRRVVAGDAMGNSEVLEDVIQTDAAINFGNSGGPLINLQGEVIGINTAINNEGKLIGFAIPVNQIRQVVESVREYGRIVRPFLGVRYLLINEQIAKDNKLPYDYGVLIVRGDSVTELAVIPGSPANKAGLVENDIILEMNGQKITEEKPLVKEIQKYKPGEELNLKIYHQGEEKTVKVVLEEYKE